MCLRLLVVTIKSFAAVGRALAGDDVLVVQEFAVVRPFEAVAVPAAAVGELAFPAVARQPRQRRERRICASGRGASSSRTKQDDSNRSHI